MPDGFKIATAWVTVKAEDTGLRGELRNAVRKAGQGQKFEIPVTARTNRLRTEITKAVREAARGQKISVDLTADTTGFRQAVTTAVRKAGARQRISVPVTADNRTKAGIASARKSLDRLKARHIKVPVTANDRTGPGVKSVQKTLARLKAKAVQIPVTLKDRTGPGATSVGKTLARLKAKSVQIPATIKDRTGPGASSASKAVRRLGAMSASIPVTVKDRTGPGIARARQALRNLQAQSPVRLQMTFTGQVGNITAAAQAIKDLRKDARGASTALTALGTKAAAAAAALDRLKNEAQHASRALLGLAVNAATAARALGDLRNHASRAATALRRLDTRADGAGNRLGTLGTRSRAVRQDMDNLDNAMARVVATMGGLRTRIGTVSTSSGRGGNSMRGMMMAALALAPALLPIAAAAVPVAGNIAAAATAVAAFGVAIVPQIVRLSEAARAQGKYSDAVRESGEGSEEAATAQAEMQHALAKMSPAAREATAGFGALRDATNKWSNALSASTMPVFTKSFATLRGVLPGLTPLIQGTANELDRLVTIAAGGVGSGAFAAMMRQFSGFSTGALREMNNGLVHLSRTFDGFGGGPFEEFMDYAKANGPIVGESLRNISSAVAHVLGSMGDMGVTILSLVNAFAQLVDAVPSEFLSTLLQAWTTFKLFGLAAAGVMAVGTALRTATRHLVTFRAAATVAGGGLAGLRAAFMGLSAAARTTIVVAGVTALVVALSKLTSLGREAPPDIDKLTTSLGQLGRTGKAGGEAARVLGKDLGELYNSVRSFTDPSAVDKVQEGLVKIFTLGMGTSTPKKLAKEELDAIDKALSNLVQGGKPEQAAAALERLKKAYSGKDGHAVKEFTSHLDKYKSALADAKFEQQVIADSMGLFGQAAVVTSTKLDEQKRSADGLRQAIQALNEVQRAGLGAMNAFEAAIDAGAKAAKENAGSLKMVHGELDLNSEKARNAEAALRDLAAKTDEAAAASRQSTGSWEGANRIYARGRKQLVDLAKQMGLNSAEAQALAKTLLNIPNKKLQVQMEKEDALKGLDAVQAAIKRTPDAKSVHVKALSEAAIKALEAVGVKVTRLPDGSLTVSAQTGQALGGINAVQRARDRLSSKSITITTFSNNVIRTTREYVTKHLTGRSQHDITGATGGMYTGTGFRTHYDTGGLVRGPGTGTSDDVFAPWLSNGEFVMKAAAVAKYGEKFMHAVNDGHLSTPGFAKGGKVKKLTQAQKERAAARKEARKSLTAEVTLTDMSILAGRSNAEVSSGLGKPESETALINTLNALQTAVAKSGFSSATNKKLQAQITSSARALFKQRDALDKVTKSLESARGKLDDLKGKFDSLKTSISSSLVEFGNITKTGKWGTSAATIINQLQSDTSRTQQFAKQLEQLKAKGLNSAVLNDIAAAGVTGGGMATAQSLLNATPEQLAEINRLQGQLTGAADAAGATVANSMYGAGIKAAEGLVKGLESQQAAIEASMMKIAKSMESAIKKALGIKSPSRVMARIGGQVSEGFGQGIAANPRPLLAARRMAMAPLTATTGPATMTTPASGLPTARGGLTINNLNLTVRGGDMTSPPERKRIARLLVADLTDELRRYDRERAR